jgi:hypothetical protein
VASATENAERAGVLPDNRRQGTGHPNKSNRHAASNSNHHGITDWKKKCSLTCCIVILTESCCKQHKKTDLVLFDSNLIQWSNE